MKSIKQDHTLDQATRGALVTGIIIQCFINLEILIAAVNQGCAFPRWGPIIVSGLPQRNHMYGFNAI